MESLGTRFVQALAAKDKVALAILLSPGIDFKGLTPGQFWEADSAAELIEILFDSWFEPTDEILELLNCTENEVAGRPSLSYRLRVRNGGGEHLVEQQAYYGVADGQLDYLRVLCSGFRLVEPKAE